MRLRWSEDFETGIKDIDRQHKELFQRVNKFLEACDQSHCKEEVDPILKFLEGYTLIHFATEEKLQQQYAYPDYSSHKAAHEEFLSSLGELKTRYKKDGPNDYLALLTYDFMINWFINHIVTEDKALCHFLKAKKHA